MSASEHSDYGYFEKRLQKIFSDETGESAVRVRVRVEKRPVCTPLK